MDRCDGPRPEHHHNPWRSGTRLHRYGGCTDWRAARRCEGNLLGYPRLTSLGARRILGLPYVALLEPRFISYSCHAACTTTVSITLTFGGRAWSINPQDISIGPVTAGSQNCRGAIYDLSAGSNLPVQPGKPGWVVGHAFLKNVYSVYRAVPPSVGFATLSPLAGGPANGA